MELHFYILVQIRVQKYGEAGCDLFLGRGGLCLVQKVVLDNQLLWISVAVPIFDIQSMFLKTCASIFGGHFMLIFRWLRVLLPPNS